MQAGEVGETENGRHQRSLFKKSRVSRTNKLISVLSSSSGVEILKVFFRVVFNFDLQYPLKFGRINETITRENNQDERDTMSSIESLYLDPEGFSPNTSNV